MAHPIFLLVLSIFLKMKIRTYNMKNRKFLTCRFVNMWIGLFQFWGTLTFFLNAPTFWLKRLDVLKKRQGRFKKKWFTTGCAGQVECVVGHIECLFFFLIHPILLWWHARICLHKLSEEGRIGKVEWICNFLYTQVWVLQPVFDLFNGMLVDNL